MPIRSFEVIRQEDESGISGTGIVAEGTVFSDGVCVLRWVSQASPAHSTVIFGSFSEFLMIHVASHPDNKTRCVFSDGTVYDHTTKVEPEAKEEPPRPRRRRKATAESKS
jgi:hypothetical protein